MKKLVIVLVILGLSNCLWACKGSSSKEDSGAKSISVMSKGSILSVKLARLDDSANPFSAEYRDWDRWAFQHLVDWDTGRNTISEDPNYRTLKVWIDRKGNLVPQSRKEETIRELAKKGLLTKDATEYTHAIAAGSMPSSLWDQMELAADQIAVKYFPKVPDWLGKNPPRQAVLLPSGYVATNTGPEHSAEAKASKIASHHDFEDGEGSISANAHAPDVWHVYDASGSEVASGTMPWSGLMLGLANNGVYPEGSYQNTIDGYTIVSDADGKVTGVYDWDGNFVSNDARPPMRDTHQFRTISRELIVRLYKAQHINRAEGE